MNEQGRSSPYTPFQPVFPSYDYMSGRQGVEAMTPDNYNHREMKQLVDEMRFK